MDEKELDKYVSIMMNSINYLGESVLPEDFPKNLVDDEDFMVDACNQRFEVFEFASPRLKSDKKYLLRMVKDSDYRVLFYADKAIVDDEAFMREAIQILGDAFAYASPCLKKNRNLAMLAVSSPCREFEDCGTCSPLEFVDKSLRADRELALLAIQHNPVSYDYLSPELKKDEEIIEVYNKVRKDLGMYIEDSTPSIPEVKVGDKIRITDMAGARELEGKVGIVERIDALGNLCGTWGKTRVIPDIDGFEIINDDDDLPF